MQAHLALRRIDRIGDYRFVTAKIREHSPLLKDVPCAAAPGQRTEKSKMRATLAEPTPVLTE
jgi:hypothetical protein